MNGRSDRAKMPMRGVFYALAASILFGLTTPLSKVLLDQINPVLLAGIFYLGSGIGLSLYRISIRRLQPDLAAQPTLHGKDWVFLLGAIVSGGVLAPAMLMTGLVSTPASAASLLLNMEGVFTALLAWFFFKENYDSRIVLGMLSIIAGGAILSFQTGSAFLPSFGIVLVICACFGWALDNNLTRKVSNADPAMIASYKGLVAGFVNTMYAFASGATLPAIPQLLIALVVGFLGYGVSLTMYVLGLRHIGAARTGAYFAIAPFLGALVALLLFHEPLTLRLIVAGALMALGLWLHVTEHHAHQHIHEELEHEHLHVHDEHHQHEHSPDDPPGEPHAHAHRHEKLSHDHPHFPDQHHEH